MTFRTVLDGLHLPECPRWHGGRLYLCDIWGGRVLTADGSTVVTTPQDAGGIGWLPDGRLLVVGMIERKVYAGGEVYADLSTINPHLLNDMIVTDDGTAYVSGFGWNMWAEGETFAPNAIIRIRPDGTFDEASELLAAPNGMALTPDEGELVVAEPGGGCVSRFRIGDDGRLVDRRVFPLVKAEGADFVTPDGICLDSEDHVWAADPMGRRVIRIAPDGTIVHAFPFDDHPLAVCLGGDDRRTLFVCAGRATHKAHAPKEPTGRLVATEVDAPGAGKP